FQSAIHPKRAADEENKSVLLLFLFNGDYRARRQKNGETIKFTAAAVSIEPVEIPSPRISEADDCGGRLDFRKAFFVGF
ncbi:hypothetical protein V7N88_002336, partial [Vibrio cholerae]